MTDVTAAPPLTHRQIMVIFSGLMLGMVLAALDQTIVATALPTITGELGGLDHLSWVVTAYLLAATVSTPLYGKLGDLYGRKLLYRLAIVIFLVGSVLSGLAQSMDQLIVFRAVQGLGGGGLIVLAQALIADLVSPRERGRYQGYFGAVFGATCVAGPLLGGYVTDHWTWRWVFFINIPFAIAALVVTTAVLPEGTRRTFHRIDYLGAALLVASVTCIVLVTTWGGTQYPWNSPIIVGLSIVAVGLLAAFIPVERRADEPVIPPELFRLRTFNIAGGAAFIVGVAMFGAISFIPLFLQVVNGSTATDSGLLIIPLMIGLLAASIVSGQIISRTGHYKPFPVSGLAIASAGMFLLSTMGTDTTQTTAMAYMVVLGIGIGFTSQTLILATQNSVPVDNLGAATSSVSFFRSLGGSIGVALFGAVFNAGLNRQLHDSGLVVQGGSFNPATIANLTPSQATTVIDAFAQSLTDVFLYATPLILFGFVLVCFLREQPLRTVPHGARPATGHTATIPEPAANASAFH
jgi:EmrB/QacA subfamily drug resistance transporter